MELACAFKDTPESQFIEMEEVLEASSFVDKLRDFLEDDEDALVLLEELLNPRDWADIPEDCRVTRDDLCYERLPRRIPMHVLALVLDWSSIRVRRTLKRIRVAAKKLAEREQLELLSSAPIGRRRKYERRT